MQLPPIIFEDDSLLVFDKPSGLSVTQRMGEPHGETLGSMIRESYGRGVTMAHSMDNEASGVSLWTKTKAALDFMSGQFQSKTAQQVFHAFVIVEDEGELLMENPPVRDASGRLPESFKIDHYLGQDQSNPELMRAFARHGGQPALTEFRVNDDFGRFVLVECRPQTNRRHQVRAHLAVAGAPVLNDALYGDARKLLLLSDIKRGYKGGANEKPMIRSLALHVSEMTIAHPETRLPQVLRAPFPLEFEIALKNLRKFGGNRMRRRGNRPAP